MKGDCHGVKRKEECIMDKNFEKSVNTLQFYSVEDVVTILGISRPKAYAIMRTLNMELSEKGFIVVSGKVSVRYFNEKLYIGQVC